MNNTDEFSKRSPEDVCLAIMDKIGVKIDFSRERHDETPLYRKINSQREILAEKQSEDEIDFNKEMVRLSGGLLLVCANNTSFTTQKASAYLLNLLQSFNGSSLDFLKLVLRIKEFLLTHITST